MAYRHCHLLGLWWQNFHSDTPKLNTFTIHILSQTYSAFNCKHHWSMFKKIHSKKNQLAQKHLTDFIFVQYNLQLHKKQI
jgi:hypothetical protein